MVTKKNNPTACIIIPVYNEAKVVGDTVIELKKFFSHIVCVNDGSTDGSLKVLDGVGGITIVNHPINLGQGAALQTGIDYALQNETIDFFVTFDADGQHGIDDVNTMLEYMRDHIDVDIVLGSRFLGSTENMSALKKRILKLAVKFSNFTTGLKLTDAHNGLRVFNRKVAERLNITMPDMAHASEILQRIADEKFVFVELPVHITYTDYSVAKSHNPNLNAVNILFDTLLHKVTKK